MTDTIKELEDLIELAKEPSSDRRRALLRKVTDVFLRDAGSHSETQSDSFGDIMHQLAYDLERDIREELSNRLASEKSAPHHLIRALANDEIEVAVPVLEQSPVLTEDDLIEVSKTQDQQHLQAITSRSAIGERLSRVLVDRGDDVTVEKLLRNDRAKIAPDTAEKITDRAKTSVRLQKPLIERSEVTQDMLVDLYTHVADEIKQKIVDVCKETDEEGIAPLLKKMTEELAESKAATAEEKIENLARRGALTENQLIKFVKNRQAMEFLLALARLTDLDVRIIRRIIQDKSGKSLVVICKANRMSPVTFKEIALSPLTGIAEDPKQMLPLITIYNRFNVENAQRVMRFWKARKHALEQQSDEPEQPAGEIAANA